MLWDKVSTVTVLEREHPEPLYRRLTTALLEQISSGKLLPGQRLPSTRELQRLYGVSSIVVRQAVVELQRQGKVFGVPGKGTFVAERKVDKILQTLDGFTEDMRRQGIAASSIVLRAELRPVQGRVAEMLAVPPGTEVAFLERVRLGDGIPMCVQICCLPHSLCPGILRHDFRTLSLYQVLRDEYQIVFGRSTHRIRASLASERESRLLQLPPAAALLWIEGCSYTTSGQVFEYGDTAYRGDRYEVLSNTVHLPTDLRMQP